MTHAPTWDTIDAIVQKHKLDQLHCFYVGVIIYRLERDLAEANRQIMMDTECIERIRTAGEKAECELAAARDKALEEAAKICDAMADRLRESCEQDWTSDDHTAKCCASEIRILKNAAPQKEEG